MRSISACTTGSATSASSSAMRTSRRDSRMFSSVRRPRPARRWTVAERRWLRDSNMGVPREYETRIIAGARHGAPAAESLESFLEPVMCVRVVVEPTDLAIASRPIQMQGFGERCIGIEADRTHPTLFRHALQLGEEPATDAQATDLR